jgi:hypothetical protein
MAYKKEVKLKHNERAAKVNIETGELIEIEQNKKLPPGYSIVKYKEFAVYNLAANRILEDYLSNIELAVLHKMITRANFLSNSLQPLNNDTSIRMLSEEFKISINTVPKLFKKLFKFGVYAQLKISEVEGDKEYWILNPYISWRGRLKKDSLFVYFENTQITALVKAATNQ